MRELKFRAWDKKTEDIFHVDKLALHSNVGMWMCVTCGLHIGTARSDYILMQFTGLLDKNDKEIFEGDIVSDENGTTAIEWADGMGAWGLLDSDRCMFLLADCHETMEVVGNIYETPELLTK